LDRNDDITNLAAESFDNESKPHYEIALNADGAQFGVKGIMKSLWPLQIQVWAVSPDGQDTSRRVVVGGNPPHIIAMHHAGSKPEDFVRYLEDVSQELIRLDPSNMEYYDHRTMTVTLTACICDTPARHSCKCTLGVTSKFPCEKCFVVGIKIGKNFMSAWDPKTNRLRTDADYLCSTVHVRSEKNPKTKAWELVISPLRKLGYFGMVTGFPLEPMHSVYHGGARNWLKKLFLGSMANEAAFSNPLKVKLEKLLDFFRHFTPAEFRSSTLKPYFHLKKWKGAEIRHWLYYVAISAWRGLVENELYLRLCDLVAALLFIGGSSKTPVPETHLDFAQKLLMKFVQDISRDNFSLALPPTVHFLLHIVNDLRHFGCRLEYLGAWVYENEMRYVLNSVHSGYRAVEQIFNREDERLAYSLPVDEHGVILSDTPIGRSRARITNAETEPHIKTNAWKRKRLVYPRNCGDFILKESKKNRDCHFIYQWGDLGHGEITIVKYLDVVKNDRDEILIIGQEYLHMEPLFLSPCNSARFHAYKFKTLSPIKREYAARNVIGKMYALPSVDEINPDRPSFPGDEEPVEVEPEKLHLLKYLGSSVPVGSKHAVPAPNFEEVCKMHYDAWEGIALRHSFDGSPASLY
jgi:hypothetical protein